MPWLRRGLLAVLALGAAGCVLVLASGLPSGPPPAGTRPAGGGAGLVQVLPAGDRVLRGQATAATGSPTPTPTPCPGSA